MKLLGAGFLWISLIYAGAICSIKLKKRVALLEKTIMMLEDIKLQLQYLNLPLYEMLNQTSTKEYLSELDYLSRCCEKLKIGCDFPSAWKKSLQNTSQPYKTEEKERLLQLGLNLGKSDTESQINIINLQISCFEEFVSAAKIQNKKYGNMTTVLGALSGCMIFILVI